jgi:transposase
MNKKYIVRLEAAERQELECLIRRGKVAAYKIRHANILLKIDADGPAWTDEEVAEACGCHKNTVRNVRQRFVEEGPKAALERHKQANPSREQKLDGKGEARLIALACSQPPTGRARWTLKMLADELVALEVVDSICDQTVRRTLKKTSFALIGENVG